MKMINSAIFGAIGAIVFITAVTIIGEISAPFKAWIAQSFGHHWAGKGTLSVAFFAVMFLIWRQFGPAGDGKKLQLWITRLFWVAAACGLILIGFFVIHLTFPRE